MFWGIVLAMIVIIPLPFLFYNGTLPDIARFRALFVNYVINATDTFNNIYPMFLFSFQEYYSEFQYILSFVLLGLVFLFRHSKINFIFLVTWFLGSFIGYTLIFHKIMPTSRYLLLSFIPAVICVGYGIRMLCEQRFVTRVRGLKGIILIGLSLLLVSRIPAIVSVLAMRHNVAWNENFGRWVEKLTPPNAVVIASDESTFIAEYGHRRIITPNKDNYFSILKEMWRDGHPVYLICPFGDRIMFLRHQEEGFQLIPLDRFPFEYWVMTTSFQVCDEILYKIEKIPEKDQTLKNKGENIKT